MASVPDTFGRSRVSYGREECVALPPAPGTEIDSGRKDDEDALCTIKFDDPNVIFCPALHSTNLGPISTNYRLEFQENPLNRRNVPRS